ncbi:MAG: sulfotransferase domain-containing protein [Chloroflexota bacterium]
MKKLLQKLFRRGETPAIIVVSGLPRSGTSMMMKMLEAGGIPPLTDKQRTADADNPQGYYEFERVKQLDKGDSDWLPQAKGKAVKVISALLKHLPAAYGYKVIFMERHMPEILASQHKMLVRRQEEADKVDDAQMAALFQKHVSEIKEWLPAQPNFELLSIHYSDVLQDGWSQIQAVNQFLGGHLDEEAMANVIDPDLYRNRQPA